MHAFFRLSILIKTSFNGDVEKMESLYLAFILSILVDCSLSNCLSAVLMLNVAFARLMLVGILNVGQR